MEARLQPKLQLLAFALLRSCQHPGKRQSPENCCRHRRNRRLLHYRSPRHVPQRVLGKQRLLRLLAVRSVTAAVSLLSSSSVIDAALRAHHKRKLFENPYVAGQFTLRRSRYRISLLIERERKGESKSFAISLCIFFMVALWLSFDL